MMSLGIPGDAAMALILGALLIQGIQPGRQLIAEHAGLFWGLMASFWIGHLLLIVFNVPLIGAWARLLRVPYRYLYPSALFFIAIGVFSTNNSLLKVAEVIVFGVVGAILLAVEFPVAPILPGYVLSPLLEENFRRRLLLSRGDLTMFIRHPINAAFVAAASFPIFGEREALRMRRTSSGSAAQRGSEI